MNEYTKEYYEEKVERLIASMYTSDSPLACDIFKRKLAYYEARIKHFERMEFLIAETPNTTIEL